MPDDIVSVSKVIETEIDNVTQGGSTTVTISNLTVPDNPLFYKYIKSSNKSSNEWINLQDNTACGNCGFSYKKNTNGTYTISFTITDNGVLDSDNTAGIIKDPVVIGSSTTTSTPSSSSSSGGGCTTSDSASMGLILILLAGVGLGVRRRPG